MEKSVLPRNRTVSLGFMISSAGGIDYVAAFPDNKNIGRVLWIVCRDGFQTRLYLAGSVFACALETGAKKVYCLIELIRKKCHRVIRRGQEV